MLRKSLTAAAAALLASTAAHADWQRASSRHFVVYSDDSPEAVKNYATQLERFDGAVRSVLGFNNPEVSPSSRVQIYILNSLTDVQRLSRTKGNVAGFYVDYSPSDVFAFIPRKGDSEGGDKALTPRQVLFHEYTHHMMYSNFEGVVVPTWFSEGFAELFATARFDRDGGVTFGQIPLYRAYGIDQSNVVPVERLVRKGPDYRDGMQTQVFYGRAWLLTDYLMFDRVRSKQLADYIGAINNGKSVDEAAKLIGATPSLDLKLDSYGRRRQWPAATISPGQINVGEVKVEKLGQGEAAMMPALIRSRNGVDARQAQLVLADARRLGAPFPADPAVQNELAESEYDAGNYDASEAAADRALAVEPKSTHALIYKGLAQTARLKKAGSKDAAAWTTARRFFLAANRVEPLYSYPPQLYYESFKEAGMKPTAAATNGLLYAYKLRPDLQSLRFEAARALLEAGEKVAARIAIEPLAYSPHGGSGADFSRKILDALNSGGSEAALRVIDQAEDDAKKKAATQTETR